MSNSAIFAREAVKGAAARLVSDATDPVVVNSFGRSGSTMLFDAIVRSSVGRRVPPRFGRWVVEATAWELGKQPLSRGRCYKTHDLPARPSNGTARVVYVFGDPVAAALSAYREASERGDNWLRLHCEHLRVPHCERTDLLSTDALGIHAHLKSWLAQRQVSVAVVRFETLWDHVDRLSDYLGVELTLPPRSARGTDVSVASSRLREVHADAIELIDSLPDWHIIHAREDSPS